MVSPLPCSMTRSPNITEDISGMFAKFKTWQQLFIELSKVYVTTDLLSIAEAYSLLQVWVSQ